MYATSSQAAQVQVNLPVNSTNLVSSSGDGSTGMFCLGVDPGIVNLGLALIEIQTKTCLRSKTVKVCKPAETKASEVKVIEKTIEKIRDFLGDVTPCHVILERNAAVPFMRILDVQTAGIVGWFVSQQIKCSFANPNSIKAFFNGLCQSKCHSQNKTDALKLATQWGYSPQTNHDADAMILCRYFTDHSNS